jgi:hypothetical protein
MILWDRRFIYKEMKYLLDSWFSFPYISTTELSGLLLNVERNEIT